REAHRVRATDLGTADDDLEIDPGAVHGRLPGLRDDLQRDARMATPQGGHRGGGDEAAEPVGRGEPDDAGELAAARVERREGGLHALTGGRGALAERGEPPAVHAAHERGTAERELER